MNWKLSPETRCKYAHVRSDAASMPLTVNGVAVIKRVLYFSNIRDNIQSSSYFGSQHNILGTCRVGPGEVAGPVGLPGLVNRGVTHPFIFRY